MTAGEQTAKFQRNQSHPQPARDLEYHANERARQSVSVLWGNLKLN